MLPINLKEARIGFKFLYLSRIRITGLQAMHITALRHYAEFRSRSQSNLACF